MKNTKQAEEFFRNHIEKILSKQTAHNWCEDNNTYEEITDLETDIAFYYDHTDEDGRDESDFSSQHADTLREAEDAVRDLYKHLARKWDFEYFFIQTSHATPCHKKDDALTLGWSITYCVTIGIGELFVSLETEGNEIKIEIDDKLVGRERKKVDDDFDLYDAMDQQRVLHYLTKQ